MGASYSVHGTLSFKPECLSTSLKELKEKFFTRENTDFGFGRYLKNYQSIDDVKSILDTIKIVFAEEQGMCDITQIDEFNYQFYSCFDASYGWEGVICDYFIFLSPYLNNDSKMDYYPDSGHCYLSIDKDGKWRMK